MTWLCPYQQHIHSGLPPFHTGPSIFLLKVIIFISTHFLVQQISLKLNKTLIVYIHHVFSEDLVLDYSKQCTANTDIDISCVHKNIVTIFKIKSMIVKFLINNFMHFETICNEQKFNP